MQKDQVDQGLSFKKRARRRLVGAVALVLLMVIILPMVLEDREKSSQQEDIEIVMPNEQSSDIDTFTDDEVQMNADNEDSLVQPPEIEETVIDEVVALPKPTSIPEKQAPKEVAKIEQKQKVEQTESKKTAAEKTDSPKDASVSNKYYVQIGVFSDPSNIEKLQAKLNDLGYKSLTEKITTDTGVKTRLRTDSFNGRNEAAIALENIKDAGLAGMVVNQK